MFTLMYIFKKYFGPSSMLIIQNINEFPYNLILLFQNIGNNDCMQFNSFINGTKNSFLIKRLIQVPSSGSCIAKAINKFDCHYTLSSVEY